MATVREKTSLDEGVGGGSREEKALSYSTFYEAGIRLGVFSGFF
jgi:hypothetical protein